MAMTLTMTVKARGYLVLDFAYLAARSARYDAPLRLATVNGIALADDTDLSTPEPRSVPTVS